MVEIKVKNLKSAFGKDFEENFEKMSTKFLEGGEEIDIRTINKLDGMAATQRQHDEAGM